MTTASFPPEDAIAFIWSEQIGLFELAYELDNRQHFTKRDALSLLDQHRYFAPLARKRRGSKKTDVADTGNVLWVDIDLPKGVKPTPQRKEELLSQIRERFDSLPVAPSVMLDSGGKGFWVYLKLSELIPTDEIEVLNRGLGAIFGGDHCYDRSRIARLPGSIHQRSGKFAEVIDFSGVVYSYADLAFLRDHAPRSPSSSEAAVLPDEQSALGAFPEFPTLSQPLWEYIERSPRRGEHGYDRSEMEQKIFTALAYRGWTDEEIISFASKYYLPRHLQEWAKRKNYSWTIRSISRAREWVEEHPPISTTTATTPLCMGSETTHAHTDRNRALRLVTDSQTKKELLHTWMTELPNTPSRATAYRIHRQLEDGGYIRREGEIWVKTDRGKHYTETKLNYLMPLPKISSNQTR